MKQFSKCCTSLLLVLLAVASSYGKEINTLPITIFGDSFYIAKGTETNLTSQDSTLQKDISQASEINDAVLYISEDAKVFIDKNNITNAHTVYLKKAQKAIAKSKPLKAKEMASASKKDTALFHALPKNKEKTTAQLVVSVGAPSPTSLKNNKTSIFIQTNAVAISIFRKRKACRKYVCNNVPNASQKLKNYALFSRPPTFFA